MYPPIHGGTDMIYCPRTPRKEAHPFNTPYRTLVGRVLAVVLTALLLSLAIPVQAQHPGIPERNKERPAPQPPVCAVPVDLPDFLEGFGSSQGDALAKYDFNSNGVIDIPDLLILHNRAVRYSLTNEFYVQLIAGSTRQTAESVARDNYNGTVFGRQLNLHPTEPGFAIRYSCDESATDWDKVNRMNDIIYALEQDNRVTEVIVNTWHRVTTRTEPQQPVRPLGTLETPKQPSADFNGNGIVDVPDFLAFVEVFGANQGDGTYQAKYDLNSDGTIDVSDFQIFVENFGS